MKKLRIDQKILNDFPGLFVGVVTFSEIENRGEDAEVIGSLRQQAAQVSEQFRGRIVTEHPNIVPWREAYRKFGAKPKDYPSSIENLIRRVLKGQELRHINKLVDVYNLISLRYILPVGGEDLDRIEGDVQLTYASENEAAVVLLGESEARSPKPGEVIYKDEIGAICRRWNWKEADRTKFTEGTRNGFLVMEALPPVGKEVVAQAVGDLTALAQKHCSGIFQMHLLDASRNEVLLQA